MRDFLQLLVIISAIGAVGACGDLMLDMAGCHLDPPPRPTHSTH